MNVRRSRIFPLLAACALSVFLAAPCPAADTPSPRVLIPLNGDWLFQQDKAPTTDWKTVRVPSSFQSHEGTNFHGVGWYRKAIKAPAVPPGFRALLHFQAAATDAQVSWNGQPLGSHLGAWTPFRFDVTSLVRDGGPGVSHELKVRLDEKVGHNTQGFLPIIAPHFGGLWQDVSLLILPETYIDDLLVLVHGNPTTGVIDVELPLAGSSPASVQQLQLRCRRLKPSSPPGDATPVPEDWLTLSPSVTNSAGTLVVQAALPDFRLWSPAEPNLYELELSLPGAPGDTIHTRFAFRSVETFGQQFRLNQQPLQIRGLLNWGYSAPLVEPNPGEATWRSELNFARSCGFNLMKFCLWVPPQRYLELADEAGMLTWMEYPTWHPDFSEKHLEPLRREFLEFFAYDRNHPSVILRSLTCETGPSASLNVIRSLYNEAHEMIPGALVEDDSSWIGWNRISDFYDDHPYGNNHTWVATLGGLNEYILAHGLKPLVLGESISADTWPDRAAILARLGNDRPWWAPAVLDDLPRWTDRMKAIDGPKGLDDLAPDSLRYGMLMRKYQAETFRREVPYGGYVISVIRDIPTAAMGLLDYLGRPKWTAADWAWQCDTICLLKTEADRRSYTAGERLRGQILLSHFGTPPLTNAQFLATLTDTANPPTILRSLTNDNLSQNPGTLAELASLDWLLPEVFQPTCFRLETTIRIPTGTILSNDWSFWIVPAPQRNSTADVQVHSSLAAALAKELFPGCPPYDPQNPANGIVVAARFDDDLVACLEHGGRVLLLPDGQRHSLPLSAHWFLRGAPFIPALADSTRLGKLLPHDFLLELQHFDLASDVVPNVPQLGSLDPILMLWDTHDQKEAVKTHGIIFETRVAKGRLLVSAARHTGATNSAGRWLLSALLDHLRSDPAPRHSLPDKVWDYLRARLHADQTNLVNRTWQFRPDPKAEGLEQGWHLPSNDASPTVWKNIRIGAWWESQGYPALDGWAWYRVQVDIPESWKGRAVFLSFEGVDDIYELYVNGQFAGKGGDLATRKDALQERRSHNITALVTPGQSALIAVRVYDWYGAGGIFRPVTLGTLPFAPELDFLK